MALDRTAVGETLGPNQLLLKDLDYRKFAAAVHVCAKDSAVREFLQEQGYKNQQRFSLAALQQQLHAAIV